MVARRSPKPQAGVRLPTRLPRGLAQSGSALALGARGRRFESCIPDQFVDVAEWLRNGLQIRIMQVRVLSSTPFLVDNYLIDVILILYLARSSSG